ncbi:MAG: hypothetical protein Q9191_001481 [Dirinaria sp. TL-2023a]
MPRPSGVHRHVWGYPTPIAEEETDRVAFIDDSQYESQLLEAFQFIQILTLGAIKLGALFFYRRIFCPHGNYTSFGIVNTIAIVTIILWTMSMFIMNALQCGSHISALWASTASVYVKYCTHTFPFEEGFSVSNFLLDLFILLLPIPREDTKSIFWSNLEAGLSLLAVNLPSLWTIISSSSATRFLASLRSLVTFSSHGSHSRILERGTAPGDTDDSRIRISDTDKSSSKEWHEMHYVQNSEPWPSPSMASADSTKPSVHRHDDIV